jgi:hypothetical protein
MMPMFMNRPRPEIKKRLEIDSDARTVRYGGVVVALEVFELLGNSANVGRTFKLVKNEGGVVHIQEIE